MDVFLTSIPTDRFFLFCCLKKHHVCCGGKRCVFPSPLPRYQSRPVPLVSVEEVNQWVENVTNGHIPNFLESIPRDVVLMLTNAMYFKGEPFHQRPLSMVIYIIIVKTRCKCMEQIRYFSSNVSAQNSKGA